MSDRSLTPTRRAIPVEVTPRDARHLLWAWARALSYETLDGLEAYLRTEEGAEDKLRLLADLRGVAATDEVRGCGRVRLHCPVHAGAEGCPAECFGGQR